MKTKKHSKKKTLKSSLKAASAAALLAGTLLVSTPSAAGATDANNPANIRERVKTVRAQLQKKLSANASTDNKLSYSENELAQWGNWGNWGNWNNWANWNNWNNWRNWANWGNWGNR